MNLKIALLDLSAQIHPETNYQFNSDIFQLEIYFCLKLT